MIKDHDNTTSCHAPLMIGTILTDGQKTTLWPFPILFLETYRLSFKINMMIMNGKDCLFLMSCSECVFGLIMYLSHADARIWWCHLLIMPGFSCLNWQNKYNTNRYRCSRASRNDERSVPTKRQPASTPYQRSCEDFCHRIASTAPPFFEWLLTKTAVDQSRAVNADRWYELHLWTVPIKTGFK